MTNNNSSNDMVYSSTDSYLWNPQSGGLLRGLGGTHSSGSHLGSGASATVYRACHKNTGALVAAKVIKKGLNPRIMRYVQTEVDIMGCLDHTNVVRFIGKESIRNGDGEFAIIMEMCEGSFQQMIKEPRYLYGLTEGIMLDVLSHLTAALVYLKRNKIVHRDIKPANILTANRPEDGGSVYKLSDFGGSLQFTQDETESFSDCFGTVEFMHPKLLEKGLQKTKTGEEIKMDYCVDLWSLGATLYNLASGNLPFTPYRGRADKNMLYRIINEKPTGCISGKDQEDGSVEWANDLPDTCQLTATVNTTLTELMAGLMEGNKYKQLTLERLADTVSDLCAKLALPVYDVEQGSMTIIYTSTDTKTNSLTDVVQKQLHKSPKVMYELIQGDLFFSDLTSSEDYVEDFVSQRRINGDNPFVLIPKGEVNSKLNCEIKDMPKIVDVDNTLSGVDVWRWSRSTLAATIIKVNYLENFLHTVSLLLYIMGVLNRKTEQTVNSNHISSHSLEQMMRQLSDNASINIMQLQNQLRALVEKPLSGKQSELNDLWQKLKPQQQQVMNYMKEKEKSIRKSTKRAKYLLTQMTNSNKQLESQKSQRLSHNLKQQRLVEMTNLYRQAQDVGSLYEKVKGHMQKIHNRVARSLTKYNRILQKNAGMTSSGVASSGVTSSSVTSSAVTSSSTRLPATRLEVHNHPIDILVGGSQRHGSTSSTSSRSSSASSASSSSTTSRSSSASSTSSSSTSSRSNSASNKGLEHTTTSPTVGTQGKLPQRGPGESPSCSVSSRSQHRTFHVPLPGPLVNLPV